MVVFTGADDLAGAHRSVRERPDHAGQVQHDDDQHHREQHAEA